jgi:hypothetical protein
MCHLCHRRLPYRSTTLGIKTGRVPLCPFGHGRHCEYIVGRPRPPPCMAVFDPYGMVYCRPKHGDALANQVILGRRLGTIYIIQHLHTCR